MKHSGDRGDQTTAWARFIKWIRIIPRRRYRLWRLSFQRWDSTTGRELRERARETSDRIAARARQEAEELKSDSRAQVERARPHIESATREARVRAIKTWRCGIKWLRITVSVLASFALFAGIAFGAYLLLRDSENAELQCEGCQAIDVVRIIDGDTLDTSMGRIRIYGADTPERGERCFTEATEDMRRLAGGTVRIEQGPRQMDAFNRNLFYLYTESGKSIDELLIRNGNAVAWTTDGQHRDLLLELELDARRGRVGCKWN